MLDGNTFTPSVISYYVTKKSPQGQFVIGTQALNNAERAPHQTIFSIKRLMGRSFADHKVEEVRSHVNYEIVAAEDESDPGVYVQINSERYSPIQISAMILKKIKDEVQKALGQEVTHAVITVPAYFDERQRAATRKAGEEAGLIVKRIIDEPTAAAIAFGSLQGTARPAETGAPSKAAGHRVLVFDLGGGTFDISIIQIVGDQYEVLDLNGSNWLGGDDFDRRITEVIIQHVRDQFNFDPTSDPRFLMIAKREAEQAKKALSHQDEYELVAGAVSRDDSNEVIDLDLVLTRDDFNRRIQSLVDTAIDLVKETLKRQNLSVGDITEVLLVGGSTAVPLVYDTVVDLFGSERVRRHVDPMHCVALGAAILGNKLVGIQCPKCQHINEDENVPNCVLCQEPLAAGRSVSGINLHEVTAKTLGIAVVRGNNPDHFQPIIPKGTAYPLKSPRRQDFRPSTENQKLIRIPVFEGEASLASQNELQGVLEFLLPQSVPASATISVLFNYDQNRVVEVTIRVLGTEYRLTQQLARTGHFPTAPIRPSEPSEDWRDSLEKVVRTAEIFGEKYKEYLESGRKAKLDQDLERAQRALANGDELEGKRLSRVLTGTVFSSGVATQLFTAESVIANAEPEVAKALARAMELLKKAHQEKNQSEIQKLRDILRIETERILERQTEVRPITDRDYQGLLRSDGDL
jgi:molecular chaperone DnaK